MNINEVLKKPEYDFLRTHERLGNQIGFLVFGGSYAYGLNGPNSDIDIRGIAVPLERDYVGFPYLPNPIDTQNPNVKLNNARFEEYIDSETDTCIYNTMKFLYLIYKCNPNTLEMLGCLPEQYAHISEAGHLLLDSRDLFITKTAYHTFGEYARQQLIRLQNAIARNSSRLDQLLQVISVIKRSYAHYEEIYPSFKRHMIEFYVVDGRDNTIDTKTTKTFFESEVLSNEELRRNLSEVDLENAQLRLNVHMDNISDKDFNGVMSNIYDVIHNFSPTGHRNHKKDDAHVCKHASHLRRLQITAKKLFRNHQIETYCGDDIEYLLDIKKGMYRNDDGTYQEAVFNDINKDMDELLYLFKTSTLPMTPDINEVMKLATELNYLALGK